MTLKETTVLIEERSFDATLQNELSKEGEDASEDGHFVSEERYWAEYYEHFSYNYEWNNGKLEVLHVSDYAQFRLYFWFMALVNDFLYVNPIARMIGLETGFRLQLPNKVTVRKPDLGIVHNSNPIPLGDKDRSYHGIFDICIESVSDSSKKEIERDTKVKKEEYAAAGVREYFILDEGGRETIFYRLDERGLYVPIRPQQGVIHSSVLPGFQFKAVDLYHLPTPPEMVDDPVYQLFASPFVRAERLQTELERQRAEEERQRAEEERQRAEHERQRADRYAAMLKSLGVDIDE